MSQVVNEQNIVSMQLPLGNILLGKKLKDSRRRGVIEAITI